MTPEHTLTLIGALRRKLTHQLKTPFGLIPVYPADGKPGADNTDTYYLLGDNGITLFQDNVPVAEYRRGRRPLIHFFLDHCPEEKRRQAAIILASSPQFWHLKSATGIPPGPLPVGHMLQTLASSSALLALILTWLCVRGSPETKPVGIYMSICFILALSSIIRLGDWWDDIRTGTRAGVDYARRLGILLAALVPFYYYANVHQSLLEKPLQYTLLSTTAAAVCMSFFSNRN